MTKVSVKLRLDESLLNVSIFWFLFSSMKQNSTSLGCGLNKTFEDVILGFRKHWSIKFQKTVKNVDQTTNQENKQINQH